MADYFTYGFTAYHPNREWPTFRAVTLKHATRTVVFERAKQVAERATQLSGSYADADIPQGAKRAHVRVRMYGMQKPQDRYESDYHESWSKASPEERKKLRSAAFAAHNHNRKLINRLYQAFAEMESRWKT